MLASKLRRDRKVRNDVSQNKTNKLGEIWKYAEADVEYSGQYELIRTSTQFLQGFCDVSSRTRTC